MMKTKLFAAGAVFCMLGMGGCSNDMVEERGTQAGKQATMTLQGSADAPQTRADYTEDGSDNTKMNFSWRSGDALSVVVDGVTGNENCQLTTTDEGKSVGFSGTVTAWDGTEKTIHVIYPYSATPYTIADTGADQFGVVAVLQLPMPQLYTIGGAISNSFMIGVGKATANGTAINASASLKQVMSIIKLNITGAPAKVTGVKLKSADEAIFPTLAYVNPSDATIVLPRNPTQEISMTVTDNTTGADKAVSFAMFPKDLSGKKIQVEVSFEDGTSKTIEKDGINFERNVHYVMAFDETPAVSDFIVIGNLKVAIGNLVAKADGSGCKIGAPEDGGLYFQFGSLVGWAGGATGDGTGRGTGSTTPALEVVVSPTGNPAVGSTTWDDPNKWSGGTDGDVVPDAYDPCRHYLGDPWRLPRREEYATLFGTTNSWTNGWTWDDNSKSAIHTGGSKFPASDYRDRSNGSLTYVGATGYFWSSSLRNVSNGYGLGFFSSGVNPSGSLSRAYGLSVRCVQD